MKDFFKNVLANIVAIMIICSVFVILMLAFVFMGSVAGSAKQPVKSNSVLVLDASTRITDSPAETDGEVFGFKSDVEDVPVFEVLKAIERAKNDDNIKGISIENDELSAGLTNLDDIRAALQDFKKSGKFVYAYGNTVSQPSYYLGSVADTYFLNPAGGIELKGLATQIPFVKQFTEKYGIGVDVVRHGKFKAAVEPVLRDDMSPENRLQTATLLNDIWGNMSKKMAESRKIDTAIFRSITDSLYGMIPGNGLKYRLADRLAQKTEYENFLKAKLNVKNDDKPNRISFAKYADSQTDETKDGNIAVLYASGDILNGKDYDQIHSRRFVKYIQDLQNDKSIKAVVFRINSPGGSANASDEILFELKQLKTKKPLVVSFGDYAASGGYYIAMGADRIFSEPNTITGSIGVFGMFPNVKELAAKNGIHTDQVTTNANSALMSPLTGLSDGTRSMLSKNIEQTYRRFVGFVMENRHKSFEQIDEIGGGRVWSGTRAKEIGLVDELGTLNDAIKYAAKLAKLNDFSVASYPKPMSKFEQIMKGMQDEDDISAKILKGRLGADYKLFKFFTDGKTDAAVMMQLPYRVEFN